MVLKNKMYVLISFFVVCSFFSLYTMQRGVFNQPCTAAAISCSSQPLEQTVVVPMLLPKRDGVDIYIEELKRKLFAVIVKTDPSVRIENFPTIDSFFTYRFADDQTILHRAICYARTEEDINLIREIIKRSNNLICELDNKMRTCLWYCCEPIVMKYMIKEVQEMYDKLNRSKEKKYDDRDFFNQCDVFGESLIISLIKKRRHVNVEEKKALFTMIKMLVCSRASLKAVQGTALLHNDPEVYDFTKRVAFLRITVNKDFSVEQALQSLQSLHQEFSFKDVYIALLSRLDKKDSFVHAIIKATYDVAHSTIRPEYQDILQDIIRYAEYLPAFSQDHNSNVFFNAVECNDIETVSLFLEDCYCVNFIAKIKLGTTGESVLHRALLKNHLELAKKLLNYFSIDAKNNAGVTPQDIIMRDHRDLLPFCFAIKPECVPSVIAVSADLSAKMIVTIEQIYNSIAYMSYAQAIEYLRVHQACINPEIFGMVQSELATILPDQNQEQKSLLTLLTLKIGSQGSDSPYFLLLKKFLSFNILFQVRSFCSMPFEDNPLCIAIRNANIILVQELLENNQSIDSIEGNIHRVTVILEYAIKMYVKSSCDGSILSIQKNRLDIIRLLLLHSVGIEEDLYIKYRDDALLEELLYPYTETHYKSSYALYVEAKYSLACEAQVKKMVDLYTEQENIQMRSVLDELQKELAAEGKQLSAEKREKFLFEEASFLACKMRNILLNTLYLIEHLESVAPALIKKHSIEQIFVCTYCLVIQMQSDDIEENLLEFFGPQLFCGCSYKMITDLIALKKSILEVLLSSCGQEWSMNPTQKELNAFFIEKIIKSSYCLESSRTPIAEELLQDHSVGLASTSSEPFSSDPFLS